MNSLRLLFLFAILLLTVLACRDADSGSPTAVTTPLPTSDPTLEPEASPTPLPPTPTRVRLVQNVPIPNATAVNYGLGVAMVEQSGTNGNLPVPLIGAMAVPEGEGPFPVALVLHGRHPRCYSDEAQTIEEWPCAGVEPRYDIGFAYLLDVLAERGYIAIAPDLNGAYTTLYGYDNEASLVENQPLIDERIEQIVALHLDALARAGNGQFDFGLGLNGRVNLDQIALLAHSTAGVTANKMARENTLPVERLVLLTPMRWDSAEAVADVPTAVLLSACDGDRPDLPGAGYFETARLDESRQTPLLSVYVEQANHNFYNNALLDYDDGDMTRNPACADGRLSANDQQQFVAQFAPDFFSSNLGDVVDITKQAATELYGRAVQTTFLPPAADRLPIVSSDEVIAALENGELSDEHTLLGKQQVSFCPADLPCRPDMLQPGNPAQLELAWDLSGAMFEKALSSGPIDVTHFDVLRLRPALDPSNPLNAEGQPLPVAVLMRDAHGRAHRANLPPLPFPPKSTVAGEDYRFSPVLPQDIRVDLGAFAGIDLTAVESVALLFDLAPSGSIMLADIEFIRGDEPPAFSESALNFRFWQGSGMAGSLEGTPEENGRCLTGSRLVADADMWHCVNDVGQVYELCQASPDGTMALCFEPDNSGVLLNLTTELPRQFANWPEARPEFVGDTAVYVGDSVGSGEAQLQEVSVAEMDGFHRLIFSFDSADLPAHEAGYFNDPHPNLPEGAYHLLTRFSYGPDALAAFKGDEEITAEFHPNVQDVVLVINDGDDVIWAAGLDQAAGFIMQIGDDPSQIWLDVYDPLPQISERPLLGVGDGGDAVRALQLRLLDVGYLDFLPVTDQYDEATRRAVQAFELDAGLVPDGVTGPETWAALEAALAAQSSFLNDARLTAVAKLFAQTNEGSYVTPTSSAGTNVRQGPGVNYDTIGVLEAGEEAEVIGIQEGSTPDTTWYQICCIEGQAGWVRADVVRLEGSTTAVSGPSADHPIPETDEPLLPSQRPSHTTEGNPIFYLTFDDGPSQYTAPVMDEVEANGGRATFFDVGRDVPASAELVADVEARGHSVQNHTWNHVSLEGLSHTEFYNEVELSQEAIFAVTGRMPVCLRPPYGATDSQTFQNSAEMGLEIVLWDIDTQDWQRPGTEVIVDHILTHAYPGAINLMHDGGGDRSQSVAALQQALPVLVERGYVFIALCR